MLYCDRDCGKSIDETEKWIVEFVKKHGAWPRCACQWGFGGPYGRWRETKDPQWWIDMMERIKESKGQ